MTDEPEEEIRSPSQRIMDAIDILTGNSKESLLREKARKIVAQIQGTMGLEGQALDKEQIDAMIERTYEELLIDESSEL